MASKKKWKKRWTRNNELLNQRTRERDMATREAEALRGRLGEMMRMPLMTTDQKVDMEAAYQRGYEAGRKQAAGGYPNRPVLLALAGPLRSLEAGFQGLNGLVELLANDELGDDGQPKPQLSCEVSSDCGQDFKHLGPCDTPEDRS